MRTRTVLFLIVSALALATCLTACRGRNHQPPEEITLQDAQRRTTERLGWVLDDLDADAQQRTALTALAEALVAEGYPLRDLRKPTREAMVRELLSGNPDAKVVHGTVDGVAGPLKAFARSATTSALKAHGILNAEQREELAEEWQDRADDRRSIRDREWILDAGLERGLNRIDATEAQFKLAFQLKDSLLTDVEGLEKMRDEATAVFIAQMRSTKPDATKVQATVDRGAVALERFAHKAADAAVELSQTLTKDQRVAILAAMEERRR
ncbi:MAG: hypothetical protein AAFS10_12695 [Myxococcota bacterium]